MNNTGTMGKVHDIIRERISQLIGQGLKQTDIATRCHLGQSTVNSYIKREPEPDRDTLKKFSHGLGIPLEQLLLAAEGLAPYGDRAISSQALRPDLLTLLDLAQHLKTDELQTLERCAEAFLHATPDVRTHLIGQLKIIERLVQHETADTKPKPTRTNRSDHPESPRRPSP